MSVNPIIFIKKSSVLMLCYAFGRRFSYQFLLSLGIEPVFQGPTLYCLSYRKNVKLLK